MKDYIATIVKNEKIAENIHAVTFALDEDICIRCGQFGNISVGGTHLLRRPIAICKTEGNERRIQALNKIKVKKYKIKNTDAPPIKPPITVMPAP